MSQAHAFDLASARQIWETLEAATAHRTPFTLGYLGTSGAAGQPHVRAVIVRDVDAGSGTIFFSTHALSAKVGQLEENPLAAITFYDEVADVQLRVEGRAEVIADEGLRRAAWSSFGDGTRGLFAAPGRPGTPLPPATDAGDEGDEGEESSSYARFAWVALRVGYMDAVDLSGAEHLRYVFTRSGTAWHAERVVP